MHLSMITYLDRVCFGTVAIFIRRDFGLNQGHMSFLYGAFTFAYAVFEVPTGWLGDRYGARRTLIRIVLWWSVFTALTGTIYPIVGWPAFAFPAMLAIRFLFGVGEAGAYPNIAHAFHNWFPFTERGSAKGAMWMAGRFAGGVTPFVVLALISEATIDGPGSVDLSVAGNLTSLVKYDAKLDEHHAGHRHFSKRLEDQRQTRPCGRHGDRRAESDRRPS